MRILNPRGEIPSLLDAYEEAQKRGLGAKAGIPNFQLGVMFAVGSPVHRPPGPRAGKWFDAGEQWAREEIERRKVEDLPGLNFDPENERRLPWAVRKHPPGSPERAAAIKGES